MAIFLTQYVGFPLGSGLNGVVSRVVGQAQEGGGARATVEDKKANVNDAVEMHTGKNIDDE